MENVEKIAIFQADWPTNSQTNNLAICLAENGYHLDLFLSNTVEVADLEKVRSESNIVVHIFNNPRWRAYSFWDSPKDSGIRSSRIFMLIARKFRGVDRKLIDFILVKLKIRTTFDLLHPEVLKNSLAYLLGKQYKVFIGVEKMGLIWAGLMSKKTGIPFIYYSLELYTWEYLKKSGHVRTFRQKLVEEIYHRNATATIIQDRLRGEILLKDNGVTDQRCFYIPVSLFDVPIQRSNYIRRYFNLPESQVVILQVGLISKQRGSIELAKTSQSFDENWKLILHGYGNFEDLQQIKKIDKRGVVIISQSKLSEVQLHECICSADIGIVLYRNTPKNDYLTVFSSEKLAAYLRSGIPVITMDYPGYSLLEKQGAGKNIHNLDEISICVRQILGSFSKYSKNSRRCYEEYYNFNNYVYPLVEFLKDL